MIENIICCCGDSQASPRSEITFNVGDSFMLKYQFVDSRFNPPIQIPFSKFDYIFEYYIKGREEKFIASKNGEIIINSILDYHKSIAKVPFSNTGLKSGYLYCNYKFKIVDPQYPTGYREISDDVYTGIKLI